MKDERVALNRRHFLASLSAMGLGSTLMPEALTIAAQGADVITIDMLEAAQKIAGVSFTPVEQQAILTRLNATRGHMAGFAALRAASLGDHEQPAIVFNPVPPGKALPDRKARSDSSSARCLEAVHRRGTGVSSRHTSGQAGRDASGQAVRADGAVSLAPRQIRSDPSLRRLSYTGVGASAGESRRTMKLPPARIAARCTASPSA